MKGVFGKNAGPRGILSGPLPIFGRPDAQFPTKNSYLQTAPRQNLLPPSRPDIHSHLTYLGTTNAEKVATDPGYYDIIMAEVPEQRAVSSPETQTSYSHATAPKRNRSPVSEHDLGSRSKKMRSPIHEVSRDVSTPETQTSYSHATAPKRNRSPVSQHDLGSQSAFQAPAVSLSKKMRSPRRNVLPQTSHNKNMATQKSGKLSDLKPLPSPLLVVDNSGTRSPQLLAEREEKTKKRRLARFGAELRQPVVELVETPVSIVESSKQQADIDFSEETAIVGLCPDMCPGPEREERERKGDLDKHEWLDGDRNRTTKFLAVKKYTRTPERDPDLIRPPPVLLKAMDYLLELLNKPYGNDFLGLYNFLWDRMRAVRMDLRMQHIFSLESISMLEQMIRLHIIAMHELCEYNKGEGFDAHLNIEQMNKALVELFQMYEDQRGKGISVPTEREFRGYYALLKLAKHPGYKVEPAELSLDLAKMSPEVRRSPEVSFARDVAKACRAGYYISFFRLAKKANYLQACLMHAHFLKLRTEALASLRSSFPSNQGIPLAQLVDMLAMEGEDVESFVENHGLVLKSFEEFYMVKDGPFLRQVGDPLSKWSPLVGTKRSHIIKLDVCFPPASSSTKEELSDSLMIAERTTKRVSPKKPDMAISDSDSLRPVKVLDQTQRVMLPVRGSQEVDKQAAFIPERLIDVQAVPLLPLPLPPVCTGPVPVMHATSSVNASSDQWVPLPVRGPQDVDKQAAFIPERPIDVQAVPLLPLPSPPVCTGPVPVMHATPSVNASCDEKVASIKEVEMEIVLAEKKSHEKMELFKERLKPIIRKWRKRAKEMRLLREKKERKKALVQEALESLLREKKERKKAPRKETGLLNIDHDIRTRLRKHRGKFDALFDRCTMVQDEIDHKLYIYGAYPVILQ